MSRKAYECDTTEPPVLPLHPTALPTNPRATSRPHPPEKTAHFLSILVGRTLITQWVLNNGNTSRFLCVMHFDLRVSCLRRRSLQRPSLSIHSMHLPSSPLTSLTLPLLFFSSSFPPPFPQFQCWRGCAPRLGCVLLSSISQH